MFRSFSVVVLVGGSFIASASCQTEPDAALKLKVEGQTLIVGQKLAATYRSQRCDSAGNLYMGIYPGPDDAKPFVKVDSHGSLKQRYRTSKEQASPGDFAIDADGNVFEMFRNSKNETTVAKFGSSGNVESKFILDGQFFPQGEFGVFKSGAVLVAVVDSNDRKKPYTAVFDSGGKLLKRVQLEDDAGIVEAIHRHDEAAVPSNQHYEQNAAVTFGTVSPSSDDNLYILRHTSPAIVYAISPVGEVVHRFKVDSGDPSLLASALFERNGQLAVAFTRWSQVGDISARIVVVNGKTGDVVNKFDADETVGSTLLCFDPPNRFTFLGHDKEQLFLRDVRP